MTTDIQACSCSIPDYVRGLHGVVRDHAFSSMIASCSRPRASGPPTDTTQPHERTCPLFQEWRDLDSWVYFISAKSGPIKIGKSDDPESRIRSLQTGHYEPLLLIGCVRGGEPLEREFHRIFAAHRLNGEWFSPTSDVLGTIRAVCGLCIGCGRHDDRHDRGCWIPLRVPSPDADQYRARSEERAREREFARRTSEAFIGVDWKAIQVSLDTAERERTKCASQLRERMSAHGLTLGEQRQSLESRFGRMIADELMRARPE